MSTLLPYEHKDETIGVSLDFLKTETSDIGTNVFLIDTSKVTGPFPIRIEAQLPDSMEEAFPPSDRKNFPIAVIATVKSIDGLMRTQTPLTVSKKSLYAGTITLDPSIVSESALIRVYAVRTTTGRNATIGYAKQKGARLAWSPGSPDRARVSPRA